MPERGDWVQLIILLLIFGGGIIRFIFQNLFPGNKPENRAGQPPRPKSPAIDILQKLRENNEAVAARQATPPNPPPPAPRDPDDAYFGDDGLEGAPALESSEIDISLPEEETEIAPRIERPIEPEKKRRSGDRIPGTIRDPREEILHPHSLDLQEGVSLPRSSEAHVRRQEIGIGEDLAVHTSTQSKVRGRRGRLRLPAALGLEDMSLRQAIIGQIILNPPKALERRNSRP